jgi:hypothetical protein
VLVVMLSLVGPFGRYPPKVDQKQKKKIVRSCLDFLSSYTNFLMQVDSTNFDNAKKIRIVFSQIDRRRLREWVQLIRSLC